MWLAIIIGGKNENVLVCMEREREKKKTDISKKINKLV